MNTMRPNPGSDVLRVRLAQMRLLPGQPAANTAAMLATIAAARETGTDLVVFPELCVPGGPAGADWDRASFLRECEAGGESLRTASAGLAVVFGNVGLDWTRRGPDGRPRRYNALFAAEDGCWLAPRGGPYPFLVKYAAPGAARGRLFCDLRELAAESGRPPAEFLAPLAARRWRLGCALGAEEWDPDDPAAPLRLLARAAPDVFIVISCASFVVGREARRRQALSAAALRRPLLFVNGAGLQRVGRALLVGGGCSGAYDAAGGRAGLPPCEAGVLAQEVPLSGAPFSRAEPPEGPAEICAALSCGAEEFLRQGGSERVVVGVSGGIDSAVSAALFSRLLARDRLLLASLPGPFTSATTLALARRLAAALGAPYAELPIGAGVDLARQQVDGLELVSADGRARMRLRLNSAMLENVQARDRSARLLAALAAAAGGVFSCNANKAELTVGYSTLYGDLAGFLAPLGDLWKGEVYALGRHLNEQVFRAPVIPPECFRLPPSAELGPDQNVDQGRGDPLVYPYHDRLFAAWVERPEPAAPEDFLAWRLAGSLEQELGFAGRVADLFPDDAAWVADLERWWRQYRGLGAIKRLQGPPILAVKPRAFGMPGVGAPAAPWFGPRYQELKTRLLSPGAA